MEWEILSGRLGSFPEPDKWYLYGKRIGPSGEIFEYADSLIVDGSNKVFPAILWDGSEYLLVWEDEPEGEPKIYGTSIIPLYNLFIGEFKRISSEGVKKSSLPAVSRIGDDVLIVWQGMDPEGYWQIYGQRLSKLNGNGN